MQGLHGRLYRLVDAVVVAAAEAVSSSSGTAAQCKASGSTPLSAAEIFQHVS
jgi:hypothetical protein